LGRSPCSRPGPGALTALRIGLLLVAVAGALSRPFRLPAWAVPVAAAVVDVVSGAVSTSLVRSSLDPLRSPVGFLLAAVPLAVLLDRLGFFTNLAVLLTRGRQGVGGLWVLAALVTTVLNLDAGVVLLTPLYVRVAHRTDRDPLTLAFPPVLLACLASSALPVSNLTNLIAATQTGAGTTAFLSHLGLPSLVATTVGWVAYRRLVLVSSQAVRPVVSSTGRGPGCGSHRPRSDGPVAVERRPLVIGGVITFVVLIGFAGGDSVGLAPWAVALAADVVLLALVRRIPWREVPVGTAVVAASLGVLAAGAVRGLGVDHLISGTSTADLARAAGLSALAANLFNNLPALLVALHAVGAHATPVLWAVLIGVNMGPVLLVTGSLASLLWLDTLGRLDVPARARDFSRVGVRVGLPAAVSGLVVSLALHLLTGT
jgi:arsenical pump membrane protein